MTTMTINVYNATEGKFESLRYTVPSFVLDGDTFAEMVQAEHVQSVYTGLSEREKACAERASKDYADKDKKAKAVKAYSDAVKAFTAYKEACNRIFPAIAENENNPIWTIEADNVAVLFTIAFGLQGDNISIEGFSGIYDDTIDYLKGYFGKTEWSDFRKQSFKTLTDDTNKYIAGVFGRLSDDGEYKAIIPELNSRTMTMFVNKLAPSIKKTKIKDSFGDIIGLSEVYGGKKSAFAFLIQSVLFKYGCEVVKTKKTGRTARHAF